jgi:hypothetical protein
VAPRGATFFVVRINESSLLARDLPDAQRAFARLGAPCLYRLTIRPGIKTDFQASQSSPTPKYMPKFIIERELPGAGSLTTEQLQGVALKSCDVLRKLGPDIQWIESYVTDDKIYCVYIAPDEKLVREHARQGGFPANRVSAVKTIIDPTTSEA